MNSAQIAAVSVCCGVILLFLLVLILRAAFCKNKRGDKQFEKSDKDSSVIQEHISEALTIPTVSQVNEDEVDWAQFEKFEEFLRRTYPNIHEKMQKMVIGGHALTFFLPGSDPSLEPIAMLAHQDVVPVTPGTEGDWTHPAFSGHNDGEFIWGRGALDMKNHLIAVMEAVESLLVKGFAPKRGLYILLGCNEEIVASENSSAAKIAAFLKDSGVRLKCVLDEGGGVIPLNVKGIIDKTLVGIGVAEKGYLDVELSVEAKGGHSSAPPAHTALGILSKAICAIEKHPYKAKRPDFIYDMLNIVGKDVKSFPLRLVTCNMWLFRPLITFIMGKIPAAASVVRSCTAVTMCSASTAPNVLPQRATAVMNLRLMPGVSVKSAVERLNKIIGDKRVKLRVVKANEAPPVSSVQTDTYKLAAKLLGSGTSDRTVAPYIVMGATDSRYYHEICDEIYRVSPFETDVSLLLTTHGTNERLPVASISTAVEFFRAFIAERCAF